MTDTEQGLSPAVDIIQAVLSLAIKRFQEGRQSVTEDEIERAAGLFGVAETEADQIMLVYELLVAFGTSIAAFADRLPLARK